MAKTIIIGETITMEHGKVSTNIKLFKSHHEAIEAIIDKYFAKIKEYQHQNIHILPVSKNQIFWELKNCGKFVMPINNSHDDIYRVTETFIEE